MHIFYLQQVSLDKLKVVAISTPRLPFGPKLGTEINWKEVANISNNGFQIVIQPIDALTNNIYSAYNYPDSYFYGRKREIHIAPGYRVKRDVIPHQILPEPVQKTDKEPDVVEPVRRPWWKYW